MADEESTNAESTNVEEVSTSSTDEYKSGEDIVNDMEDIEVDLDDDNEDLEEESTEEESTEETTEEETPEEDVQEVKADIQPVEAEEEAEPTEVEDTTTASSEDEQKRINDEHAKRRIAERQLREEREAREKENLDRYLAEAGDDEQLLNQRKLEVERFNIQRERASINQEKLQVGIDRAIADIDLFKSGTPEQKEELARRLDIFEQINVVKDDYGNPVEVKNDVYQYLQAEADSIKRLASIGATQQVQQKKTQKSRTLTPPVKTPKQPKSDPLIEGFDEEAGF